MKKVFIQWLKCILSKLENTENEAIKRNPIIETKQDIKKLKAIVRFNSDTSQSKREYIIENAKLKLTGTLKKDIQIETKQLNNQEVESILYLNVVVIPEFIPEGYDN